MIPLKSDSFVNVDLSNPGQFFACCGLLELADQLWPGAVGWFEKDRFVIRASGDLQTLIHTISHAPLVQVDPTNDTSSPIMIDSPFNLLLDWWLDEDSGGRELKVWAGTMESVRIAKAMQFAMREDCFQKSDLLDIGTVAYDPDSPEKKVEPYYFDARRGPNAHSRDVGFSPNDLKLTTTAFPAVELLCLVGLQRCRPLKTDVPRVYDYIPWESPLPPELTPLAITGFLPQIASRRFRFENWYRTGQKKHKAFLSANLVSTKGE